MIALAIVVLFNAIVFSLLVATYNQANFVLRELKQIKCEIGNCQKDIDDIRVELDAIRDEINPHVHLLDSEK